MAYLTPRSTNILEYVADLADQRKLGAGGNLYCGANNVERFRHRANAQAVRFPLCASPCDHLWQAHEFYLLSKVWLGAGATPEGFFEKTLPEWFTYFQACAACSVVACSHCVSERPHQERRW